MNRSAGLIYLVDTPRRVAAMTRWLDDVAESLQRQVFIEAKIFEVKLNDEHEYGIDWESLQVGFEASESGLPDIMNIFMNGGSRVFRADTSELNVTVDFLRTQGEISVLSSPHLSVMNGQSAVMTVGFQFPFGDVDGVDRDAETGLVTYGSSIKRVILGLQLGLTPQISEDGMITLHIVPSITKIQGEETVTIPLTVTETQEIRNPIIALQEFSTTVRVQSGESVILAGLTSQTKELEEIGLPIFGSIPWIGTLFKHVEEKLENKELVIFISPIVREAG
jgi:MSHA biogenesis protein MshL